MRCAESVLYAIESTGSGLGLATIFIVDNGSEQAIGPLRDWCAAKHPVPTRLLENADNLGFAGGMNTGIRHALPMAPDFVWLLNNDLVVAPDAITRLLLFSRHNPNAAITGATVLDPASGLVRTAGGYRYYPWLGLNLPILAGISRADLAQTKVPPPDYVDGAAMWLRGDFISRLGRIPCHQFMYFEELELNHCLRGGETIAWCREAEVSHEGGGSAPTASGQATATYYAALGAFTYTRRHHLWYLPTVIIARLLGISLRALARRQPGLVTATLRALRDFPRQV